VENELTKVTVSQLTAGEKFKIEVAVAREQPLTIILNNKELVTLLCTPVDVDYLAIGFLFSEGLIKNKADIKKVSGDDKRGIVRIETYDNMEPSGDILFKRIITSGCGRGASFYNIADMQNQVKVESGTKISAQNVLVLTHEFSAVQKFIRQLTVFHSAALCDARSLLVFNEDVGRHNAVDKIFGECVIKGIATNDCIMITSGRISSEILLKVAHRNIPILISVSAPTDLGVKLANDLGVTIIGLVRGKKMIAYTNDWRIDSGG